MGNYRPLAHNNFHLQILVSAVMYEDVPMELQHTGPLAPDREPKTDQSNESTRVQFSEPVNLLGLLTGVLVRVTYRNKGGSKGVVSPNV